MLLCTRRAHFAVIATSAAAAALLTVAGLPTANGLPPDRAEHGLPAPTPNRYIVTLSEKPIATYGGVVRGIGATRPGKGERVDVTSGRAKRYRDYLERQHSNAAARVGAKPLKHYAVSLKASRRPLRPTRRVPCNARPAFCR